MRSGPCLTTPPGSLLPAWLAPAPPATLTQVPWTAPLALSQGSAGYRPDSITIAGGATRSPVWLQLHADICGIDFVLTQQPEAPMLGCAILVRAVATAL